MLLGLPKFEGPQLRVAFKSALKVPLNFDGTNAEAETTLPIFPAAPKIGLINDESFITVLESLCFLFILNCNSKVRI